MPFVGCRSLCATGSPCRGPERLAASDRVVGAPGLLVREFGREGDDGVDARVHALDLAQVRVEKLGRATSASRGGPLQVPLRRESRDRRPPTCTARR